MNRLPGPFLQLFGIADRTLPSVSSLDTGYRISLRNCLLLCIPAIVIGGYLRFELLRSVPVIFYGPDGNSYFHTVAELWMRGVLKIDEKRRWLYPLLLVPLPLSPFSPAVALAWVQHMLGLLAVIPLGWIVGHVTRFRSVWIPAVTTLYAVWPHSLWYEHELLAEPVFLVAFLTTTALAFPLRRLAGKNGIFLYLTGAAIVALLKSLGRPIWAVLIVFLLLINRRPLAWGCRNWVLLAVTVVLIATAGGGRQGGWLFLSSTLPLVPAEGSWPEYRKLLQPLISEARGDLPNYAFRQSQYKKVLNRKEDASRLGPEWAALVRDDNKFQSVVKSLAFSAYLSNPTACARLSVEKVFVAGSDGWLSFPNLDTRQFYRLQKENNEGRWKIKAREMELLYRMPQKEFESCSASFRATPPWFSAFFQQTNEIFAWGVAHEGGADKPPEFGLRWPGWLVVIGFFFCLLPGRFFAYMPVWAPTLAYLASCFSVGDSLGRYFQPIEWVGMVIACVAIDSILSMPVWIRARWRTLRQQNVFP
jgi:hypothetical protein